METAHTVDMKILVVDDDPVARLLIEATLKATGHDVVSVSSAETAWENLADRNIRIILADWWMPGMDGLELCRRVRCRGGNYVYFILVTNQSDSTENFRTSSSAGIDDYITKPVQPSELRLRVDSARRVLEKRETERGGGPA